MPDDRAAQVFAEGSELAALRGVPREQVRLHNAFGPIHGVR